ncbi:MAG TPA: tetratricopeptide repeat protein [Accumulibacter sp.]|mgnify:CR=1 FL=1|nr:tetratricopeptide repeat protein [Accumulibacter sp.]
MATYDLEEQEQIAELKAWWKQYGNLILGLLTAASLAVLAWQGWNWYQRNQAAQASAIHAVLQKAIQDKDMQRVKAASGEMVEKFPATALAPLAALSAAKAFHDTGDAKTAKLQLAWVVEHGRDEVRDLARLRLATLLIDEKAYDEALQHLATPGSAAFAVRFADGRGDVLAAQGKKSEARAAYQSALDKLIEAEKAPGEKNSLQDARANAAYRELLQLKLDSLGDGQ